MGIHRENHSSGTIIPTELIERSAEGLRQAVAVLKGRPSTFCSDPSATKRLVQLWQAQIARAVGLYESFLDGLIKNEVEYRSHLATLNREDEGPLFEMRINRVVERLWSAARYGDALLWIRTSEDAKPMLSSATRELTILSGLVTDALELAGALTQEYGHTANGG